VSSGAISTGRASAASEREIKKRLDYWDKLRQRAAGGK